VFDSSRKTCGVYLTDGKGSSRFQLASNMVAVLARENIKLADSKVSVRPSPNDRSAASGSKVAWGNPWLPPRSFCPPNR
jgi:hypothetical protein